MLRIESDPCQQISGIWTQVRSNTAYPIGKLDFSSMPTFMLIREIICMRSLIKATSPCKTIRKSFERSIGKEVI
jgi:hypothetical protein